MKCGQCCGAVSDTGRATRWQAGGHSNVQALARCVAPQSSRYMRDATSCTIHWKPSSSPLPFTALHATMLHWRPTSESSCSACTCEGHGGKATTKAWGMRVQRQAQLGSQPDRLGRKHEASMHMCRPRPPPHHPHVSPPTSRIASALSAPGTSCLLAMMSSVAPASRSSSSSLPSSCQAAVGAAVGAAPLCVAAAH